MNNVAENRPNHKFSIIRLPIGCMNGGNSPPQRRMPRFFSNQGRGAQRAVEKVAERPQAEVIRTPTSVPHDLKGILSIR